MATPDQINQAVSLRRNQYYKEGEYQEPTETEKEKIERRKAEIKKMLKTI